MSQNSVLQPNESIVLSVHQHWIVLLGTGIAAFCVAVIPLFVPLLFGAKLDPFVLHLFWFFYTILVTLLWVGCGFNVVDYLMDSWIITDSRLIDIEQDGFFHRRVTTMDLKNIQNIVVEVSGIDQTILRTGTITIETAGEHTRSVIPNVPYPETVKQILLETAKKSAERLRANTSAV